MADPPRRPPAAGPGPELGGDPAPEAPAPEPPAAAPEEERLAGAAASALARAREAARAAGLRPSSAAARRSRRRPVVPPELSTARADGRDPVLLGAQLDRLVTERGWQDDVAVGSVVARWPAIVGPQVAAHVTPETFEDAVLTVRADSTGWATQLRYMVPMLLERLAAEVGEGTVADLRVLGPAAPSWRKGRRTAPGGRGPRDTYG